MAHYLVLVFVISIKIKDTKIGLFGILERISLHMQTLCKLIV